MNSSPHRDCYSLQPFTKDGKPRRTNTHPIPCVDCGQPIPAGAAYVERSSRTKQWIGFPIEGRRP